MRITKLLFLIIFFQIGFNAIAQTPPKISATGNQIYCSGTTIKIVTNATITHDIADIGTEAIYIQISSGYIVGQDLLKLANLASHPNITSIWSAPEGKLKLYSPTGNRVTYIELENAIKDVVYSSSSSSPSGIRNFSINLGFGSANYLPRNGHFYEFVPSLDITWINAKAAASTKFYYGWQGYLATLTAADEAQLAGAQAPGAGWIGGTDVEKEGIWKWVTGPEGLANGGAGTIFWNGNFTGNTTPPNYFAFWNTNSRYQEPNNTGGTEHYAHITNPDLPGSVLGAWNDMGNAGGSGLYRPQGYIVEYGGMPGELPLEISASTTITIPTITSTTPDTICENERVVLKATATNGIVYWYSTSTGGPSIFTGDSYTTGPLSTTTTYYVDATNSNCPTTSRTAVMATVKPLPPAPIVNNISYCQNEKTTSLSVTASANGTLNWYSTLTGGTASATTPTPSAATAGTTKYYVSQTNSSTGCEGLRAEIIVTINPLPTAPIATNISFCQNETTTSLTVNADPNCSLKWYAVATGGTSSSLSPTPSSATIGTTSYFVSQTNNTTNCEGPRTEIIVTINPLPIAPIANNISFCHNETAVSLTATASANATLNWYTLSSGGTASSNSPTPLTTTVGTTKYYVSQSINGTNCEGPRAELTVTVNALPVVNNISIIQCDTDLVSDGKTFFNLTANNNHISTNYSNENFTYYTSQDGANNSLVSELIPDELAFKNTTATTMEVWARVANKTTNCFSVAKLTLKVPATNISPDYKIIIPAVCDDFLDINGNNTANNNNRDGIASFNLTSSKAIIEARLPTTDVYKINYYRKESDALAQLNVIADISNYRNIGYPNSQDIWVRVDSNIDNACYGLGPYLTLNVEALPTANTVIIPRQCDNNNTGIFTFDTRALEDNLLKGQTNVTVTYFEQNGSALKDSNGNSISSPFPAGFSTISKTIKAVVTNNTTAKCFDETSITFTVDKAPKATAIPVALTTVCYDELNPKARNGKFEFDTSGFETAILGEQTGMTIKYFDQNGNELLPLPNPFITATQDLTVIVENPLNKNCVATTKIKFVVNPIPKIDLNLDGKSDELVCSNDPSFSVTLDAGILDNSPTANYNYVWKKNGTNLNTNSPTLSVNSIGVYSVEVINSSTCSSIRTITVNASNLATINSIDIAILTNSNTITVNATGPGDYQYSLDEPNNFWQNSNFFDNVSAGIHQVYIKDKNGCGIISEEIVIIGFPKFFTPNNDDYNDVWEIKGMTKYPTAVASIFDRYGKLITTLGNFNQSWNGTIDGRPLPADDYWYVLKLDATSPQKTGHFSLKR